MSAALFLRKIRLSAIAGLVMLLGYAAIAAEAPTPVVPAGGIPLFASGMAGFNGTQQGPIQAVYRAEDATWVLDNQLRGKAVPEIWDGRIAHPIARAFTAGETIHISVETRSTLPLPAQDTGAVQLWFQGRGQTGFNFSRRMNPSAGWERYDFVIMVPMDIPANQAQVLILFGVGPQTNEVRALTAQVYPVGFDASRLPQTRYTYKGREANAAWRSDALARIASHRQQDFTVTVRNAQGKPVANRPLTLTQQRPAFHFGSALIYDQTDSRYYQEFDKLFTLGTPEHLLKSEGGGFSHPKRKQQALEQIEWLGQRGKAVYAHVLFWPMWHYNSLSKTKDQERIAAFTQNPQSLRDWILSLAEEKLVACQGKVIAWDVINEMHWQREMLDVLNAGGISDADLVADLVRMARRIDPQARLIINEVGLFENNTVGGKANQDYYLKLLADLKGRGAMPDGFGFQSHFGSIPSDLNHIYATFDVFANLGLRLYITEFDIATDDEQLQADWTRDFYILAYSHPAVDAITMWGFWEERIWKGEKALFRKDWTPKPNALVFKQLLSDWSTRLERISTDATGTLKFRGFSGTYQVTGPQGQLLGTLQLTLQNPRATLQLP